MDELKCGEMSPSQMIAYYQARMRVDGKEEEIPNVLVSEYLIPDEDIDLDFIACACNVSREVIDKMPGSEIIKTAKQVKEMNPVFFDMKGRIKKKSMITVV